MKSVAYTFTKKREERECSIQEYVYRPLSSQWLRETFHVVVFANSNLPEKRYRLCLSEGENFRTTRRVN